LYFSPLLEEERGEVGEGLGYKLFFKQTTIQKQILE